MGALLLWDLLCSLGTQTLGGDIYMDIATLLKNRPRGQFFENGFIFLRKKHILSRGQSLQEQELGPVAEPGDVPSLLCLQVSGA